MYQHSIQGEQNKCSYFIHATQLCGQCATSPCLKDNESSKLLGNHEQLRLFVAFCGNNNQHISPCTKLITAKVSLFFTRVKVENLKTTVNFTASMKKYHPAPWIYEKEECPTYIWYWIREGEYAPPRSCMDIKTRSVGKEPVAGEY